MQVYARKEPRIKSGLQFVRRQTNDGKIYFITNRSDKAIDEWVPLQMHASSVALFDPMTGKAGLARLKKKIRPQPFEVYLQLQPYESIIVRTYDNLKSGKEFPYNETKGQEKEIEGNWTIEFLEGGPTIPSNITTAKLASWTELGGEDVKNFSGTAGYSIFFDKPANDAKAWILNLGKVNETAQVLLNGKKIATLIGPSFQCMIPSSVLQPKNEMRIIVANLMANRIAYMDRNNIPWKIFYNTNMPARRRENAKNGLFDASGWKPLPSGLLGPVTLTPIK